ncbi:uncharacterized protein [Lolium perenne]|uniref:uncharacterized protein n=1 Tax=Lolium perenne TaxID=4522 RepID=UPI0021EA1BE3|nr:uncharacterized protein LOC127317195 [Lolium perenne]
MEEQEPRSWEYHLRKYLALLATLVATSTYAAGLSPPGGVWQENKQDEPAGVPILYHSPRYLAFFYFNATAFAASLVVNLLLLVLNESRTAWLSVLRVVMVLDLLALMGAFATGSCEDLPTTVYVSVLVIALAIYVGIKILLDWHDKVVADDPLDFNEHRKELLVLATFATGLSFAAGLSPPGGFRDDAEGDNEPGDPILKAQQSQRLMAFFYCNTTAFVASLLVIVLLLGRRMQKYYGKYQLYGFILVVLLGLLGAYAAGSSRKTDTTVYVVVLVAAVPVYIFLVMVVMVRKRVFQQNKSPSPARVLAKAVGGAADEVREGIGKAQSLILLLATLAATITYQAGMDPPGGVWPEDGPEGLYEAGDPILLSTHPARYKVFFYCNSTAFVASLVVILMVQNTRLMKGHALEVAMILDLFGLIGAYAAGSCRDVSTSIYVMALAGGVLVYVVIHVVFFTLDHEKLDDEEKRRIHKRRKRLLLLSILVATITYQAGLTPPGGFWTQDGKTPDGHDYSAGSAILGDVSGEYRRRYLAYFYCNSTSFMASMALILMLVNPNLYRPGIRSYALYVCMVVAVFGLMGAYAAGSARQLRTSIYVFVLVGAVVAFILIQLLMFFKLHQICGPAKAKRSFPPLQSPKPKPSPEESSNSSRRKYLMLLAILAASVTYQAGLKPPGGMFEDGVAAGNPVLRVSDLARYRVFFYCNTGSFAASVVVIVLLLQEFLHGQAYGLLIHAMNTAIVLDVLGLLGAYAAGSSREWDTSGYVIALTAVVLAFLAVHLVIWVVSRRSGKGKVSNVQLQPEPKVLRRCASSPAVLKLSVQLVSISCVA